MFASSFLLAATLALPPQLDNVGVVEQIGRQVDLNLTFTGENGYPVKLGDFFHAGRPVILDLVYYSCPMLCNLVLNGQATTMRQIPWTAGGEFEVVTISFDPTETFELARQKKPFGLVFDDISGGYTMTGRESVQAFKVQPLLVYKVYADGRPDEVVRGVDIVGTPIAGPRARSRATSTASTFARAICGWR